MKSHTAGSYETKFFRAYQDFGLGGKMLISAFDSGRALCRTSNNFQLTAAPELYSLHKRGAKACSI